MYLNYSARVYTYVSNSCCYHKERERISTHFADLYLQKSRPYWVRLTPYWVWRYKPHKSHICWYSYSHMNTCQSQAKTPPHHHSPHHHHRLTLPSIPYFSSGRARTTDDGIYWVLVHECLHVHVKSIVLLVLMLLPWCCCYCCGCCHCYWPGFSVFRFRFSKYSLKH